MNNMSKLSPVSVLLADDHAVLRAGLHLLIDRQEDFTIIGEASSGLETITLVDELQPDLLLLDISMPGLGGLDALPTIKKKSPSLKILILTMHDDPQYLRQALKAGASGYIPKKAADSELLSAMRAVQSGDVYVHPSMTNTLVDDLLPASKPDTDQDLWTKLSEREKQVLRLTALGHTGVEVAEKLNLSPKTIETYRARGMEKLNLQTRAALVRYALQHGKLTFE